MNNRHGNESYIIKGVTIFIVGVIFYFLYLVLNPFLGILSTALLFAIFLNPLYKYLLSKTKRNGVSGFLTILLLIVTILLPLGLIARNLLVETAQITTQIQGNPQFFYNLESQIRNLLSSLSLPITVNQENINNQVTGILSFLGKNLGGIALQSGSFLLNLFFMLLALYFFLVRQDDIKAYISNLSLFPTRYIKLIQSRTKEIVEGTIRGYLLVLLLQSLVGISGFFLFGIPAAFLLGTLYGVSSLLPLIGGFIFWVPIAIWLAVSGNVTTAVLLAVWFYGLGFLIENIIAPKIIGGSTKLHQLFVMFSVFGGIQHFGLLGLVLGPLIIALAFIALEIVKEMAVQK